MAQGHKWDPVCSAPVGLVRPVRLDPTGGNGTTRGQARSRWRRTSQGFYVLAGVDSTRPEQRIMEQSVRLPVGGAVTGWACCRLRGANFFDGILPDGRTPIPVPLAIGPSGNIRPDPAVSLSWDRLDASEVVVRHGRTRRAVPRTRPGGSSGCWTPATRIRW